MATVPVPHTWTAGDSATSANLQTLTDAILFLLGSTTSGGVRKAFFKLRQTVAQALGTSGTFFGVTFDAEDVDYDNGHSTVTNTSRYTAQTAGWYGDLGGMVGYVGNATGQRLVQLAVNGTGQNGSEGGFGTVPNAGHLELCTPPGFKVFLNAADYVELQAMQSSGGSLNTFLSGGIQPVMCGEWRSN